MRLTVTKLRTASRVYWRPGETHYLRRLPIWKIGSVFSEFMNFVDIGPGRIEAFREAARDLGQSLSTDVAANATILNRQLRELVAVMKSGAQREFLTALGGSMNQDLSGIIREAYDKARAVARPVGGGTEFALDKLFGTGSLKEELREAKANREKFRKKLDEILKNRSAG